MIFQEFFAFFLPKASELDNPLPFWYTNLLKNCGKGENMSAKISNELYEAWKKLGYDSTQKILRKRMDGYMQVKPCSPNEATAFLEGVSQSFREEVLATILVN